PHPETSVRPRAARAPRTLPGAHAGPSRVRHGAGARALRRSRGALRAPARCAAHRVVRAHVCGGDPRRELAAGARRLAARRGRARCAPSRAPAGKHTVWAYCHVPNGSTVDMTERIEAQLERFAPGFSDRILARSVMGPAEVELHNENNIGGDIGGGSNSVLQFMTRPFPRLDPYTTSARELYLCSSSTPPGGGVHGM